MRFEDPTTVPNDVSGLSQLEAYQELLARQELVASMWACFQGGNAPNVFMGRYLGCNPSPTPQQNYLGPPNNGNLGIVRGWTLEQIEREWAKVRGPGLHQWILQTWGGMGPNGPFPLDDVEAMERGLWYANAWVHPLRSKRVGLALWYLRGLSEAAQARTRAALATIAAMDPRQRVGVGSKLRSPRATDQGTTPTEVATGINWGPLQRGGTAETGGGLGVTPAAGNGGGMGITPNQPGGGMGITPNNPAAGNSGPRTYGSMLQNDLQAALQRVGVGQVSFKIPDVGGALNAREAEPTTPGGGSGEPGLGDLPPPDGSPVLPGDEVELPDPYSPEASIAEAVDVARTVIADPAETARRIILEQSRADLDRALLVGAAAGPQWQQWAGEAWQRETRSALGAIAYEALGGDWSALLACFAAAGMGGTEYMAWLMAVIDQVRAQLRGGTTPGKKKKGGGAGLLFGLGAAGLVTVYALKGKG